MLEMRPNCECCDRDLPADAGGAYICTFECTFCTSCATDRLRGRCPNCGGELVPRPDRPREKLAANPASTRRVHKPGGCTAPAPRLTVPRIQALLGWLFLLLGGWCLLFPGMVERLGLRPEHLIDTTASNVLMGCFGAQAMLCGLLILLCRFDRRAFLVFGLAGSLPFFVFNVYFTLVEPVFTSLMLIDVAGNVSILALCLLGASRVVSPSR